MVQFRISQGRKVRFSPRITGQLHYSFDGPILLQESFLGTIEF